MIEPLPQYDAWRRTWRTRGFYEHNGLGVVLDKAAHHKGAKFQPSGPVHCLSVLRQRSIWLVSPAPLATLQWVS